MSDKTTHTEDSVEVCDMSVCATLKITPTSVLNTGRYFRRHSKLLSVRGVKWAKLG